MYDKYFKNVKFEKFVFLYDIKNKKLRESDIKEIIALIREKVQTGEITNTFFENIKLNKLDKKFYTKEYVEKLLNSAVAEIFSEEYILYFYKVIDARTNKKLTIAALSIIGGCIVISVIILVAMFMPK